MMDASQNPTREYIFLQDVKAELRRARAKFPMNRVQLIPLVEEVGELAQALMDKPWYEVRKEAIQVACMAMRVALDGDESVITLRQLRGLDIIP